MQLIITMPYRSLTNSMCSLPDFSLVIAVEEMLSGTPLCEHKLQGGFPGGARDVGKEVKHSRHVTDHQLGEHHHQTLSTNNRCYHTQPRSGIKIFIICMLFKLHLKSNERGNV